MKCPHEVSSIHKLDDLFVVYLNNIDGLVQERRNSSALAMELRPSCTDPSICWLKDTLIPKIRCWYQYVNIMLTTVITFGLNFFQPLVAKIVSCFITEERLFLRCSCRICRLWCSWLKKKETSFSQNVTDWSLVYIQTLLQCPISIPLIRLFP